VYPDLPVRNGSEEAHPIVTTNATAATQSEPTPSVESYEHINLRDVDDSRQALPEAVYTLEVNKIDAKYVTVTNPNSELKGTSPLVLKASYTIVDDPKYSGRKYWEDFWTPFKFAQVNLKKQMNATGVLQAEGESLSDYAAQFALLNPPARFQVLIQNVPDKRDPTGPPVNRINWFSAKPIQ